MLWAVHISDGVLTAPWWQWGFVAAALLCWWGAWGLREDEIPRVALLTAAFFISSTIHVPLAGSSIHLLLNGLLGVVLGRRASLAILIGLGLQALLLQHGGFFTLGINTVIQAVPAIAAGYSFGLLLRWAPLRQRWFCRGLVIFSYLAWVLSLIVAIELLIGNIGNPAASLDLEPAWHALEKPGAWAILLAAAGFVVWLELRWPSTPDFALGLLIGEATVLATIALQAVVLRQGAESAPTTLILILVLAHLPLAVIEGLILGVTVGFLGKVKPELLGSA